MSPIASRLIGFVFWWIALPVRRRTLQSASGFYRVVPSFFLSSFTRLLPSFTGFCQVLQGHTGFLLKLTRFIPFFLERNCVLSDFAESRGVSPSFTGFYRVLLRFYLISTGFYRVLLGFYRVLMLQSASGFAAFHRVSMEFHLVATGFYRVVPSFFYRVSRDFYRVLLGFARFYKVTQGFYWSWLDSYLFF